MNDRPVGGVISLYRLGKVHIFELPARVRRVSTLSFFSRRDNDPFVFLGAFGSTRETHFSYTRRLNRVIVRARGGGVHIGGSGHTLRARTSRFSSRFLVPASTFFTATPHCLSLRGVVSCGGI